MEMLFCHKLLQGEEEETEKRLGLWVKWKIPRDIIVSNKAYFLFETSPHPVLGLTPCLRFNCRYLLHRNYVNSD